MDWVQIDGKEIPLLEPPETHKDKPRRLLQVLFKYKRLILTTFLCTSLPALLVLLLMPTKYLATSKVFIKPSRAFVNLNPKGSDSGVGVLPSPEVLASEIQIITSRELGEQLGKDVPFPDDGIFASAGPLAAKPVRGSSIIEINLTSTNPVWAVQAVNRVAELYQEQHVKVHKTPGVEEFYDKQEKKLGNELLAAEEALKAFQEKEKIIDAPQEVIADLAALGAFERNLKETDSSIRETEQRIAMLDDQLKQQKATISSNTNITPNPVYVQIRAKLTQLELERDSLLQRYTADDRLVKDKEKEIEELKKNLETVKPTSVGSENIALNDVHRRILNELLGARVQLRALNEKKTSLTRQVEDYSSAAADKKRKGFEYDRLLRDVNSKKENLDLYRKRAEEARISDAMDERKFSNSYILERASLPLPNAGWSPLLVMMMILFVAAGMAIGLAFGLEYFDHSLRNEGDIEEQIGLPVLATIQYYGDLRAVRQIPAEENI
jgi:succinoglycan biosynthesis transport protein ExoP